MTLSSPTQLSQSTDLSTDPTTDLGLQARTNVQTNGRTQIPTPADEILPVCNVRAPGNDEMSGGVR